jgi:hypothetical protein
VSSQILDEKAKIKLLSDYDPDSEAALLETKAEVAKINTTARHLADGIWKPFIAKLRKRRPLIEIPNQSQRTPKMILKPSKAPYRKHLHYVPQFTTRPWADRKSGKFWAYRVGVDGEVQAETTTAKLWGAAPLLYSQGLESLLGLIEGDARRPYEKLTNIVPLNEMEVRRWIAFLIAQLIRTPRFMRTIHHQQRTWIERTRFDDYESKSYRGVDWYWSSSLRACQPCNCLGNGRPRHCMPHGGTGQTITPDHCCN